MNDFGTSVRVPKQTPQSISSSITSKLDSVDIGVKTEAKVADYIRTNSNATITDFGNKIKTPDGNPLGDIDVATTNTLIEVKASISSVKQKQLYKYVDHSLTNYINIGNKNVVLYIDEVIDMSDINNVRLIENIENMGITVVNNNLDVLKGLVD